MTTLIHTAAPSNLLLKSVLFFTFIFKIDKNKGFLPIINDFLLNKIETRLQ